MNKKIKIMILIIVFSFIFNNKVKAIYNGSGGTSYNGTDVGECGNLANCVYNNKSKLIIQARLYYVENGNFSQIGKTYYFVDIEAKNMLKDSGLNIIHISEFDNFNDDDKYSKASQSLNKYFNQKKYVVSFLNDVVGTNYASVLTKESQSADFRNPATKGYRIVIEPALNYVNPTFSNDSHALITVKGMAAEAKRIKTGTGSNGPGTYSYKGDDMPSCTGIPNGKETCSQPLLGIKSQAQYFYITFNDVGISKTTKEACEGVNTDQLADIRNGCGYNLIDISNKLTPPVCYGIDISNEEKLKCENYEQNNVAYFEETYTKLNSCSGLTSNEQKMISNDGILVAESGTCSMYCKEKAMASFPGNISTLIKKGSYFAWPTRQDDVIGKYSMSMESTFECKIKDVGVTDTVGAVATRTCDKNYKEYDAEKCRTNTTKQRICPEGYTMTNGKCLSKQLYCEVGTILKNGQCEKAIYSCPSPKKLKGTDCYDWKCPSKTTKVDGQGSTMRCQTYTCPSGFIFDGTNCVKDAPKTRTYHCNNVGGTLDKANNICKKSATVSYSCQYGGDLGSDGYCYKSKAPSASCGSGWTEVSQYRCRRYSSTIYSCPNYWTYRAYYKDCIRNAEYYEVYNCGGKGKLENGKCVTGATKGGLVPAVETLDSQATIKHEYKQPYQKETNSICPINTADEDGKCYTLVNKIIASYKCPTGYTLDGTTCKKVCNRNALINAVKTKIQANEMSAKLTAGTNRSINKVKLQTRETTNYDDQKLIFTRKVYFEIPSNINRYYNRVTGIISNSNTGVNIFDRKEGVVSLSKNDATLEGNSVKNYQLKISDVNLGTDNKYGSSIKNYICYYKVTDRDDCTCPSGTRNEGVSVEYLTNKICSVKNQFKNKSCVDWQNDLCNYNLSTSNQTKECVSDNKFYCKDTQTKTNVDITFCVSILMQNKNETLQTAIEKCTLKETKCSNDYCINTKTNERINIKPCLDEGNSRTSCLKQMGCLDELCPASKCCTGKCEWKSNKISNVVYSVMTCDNNSKTTQYCNFEAYCKGDLTTTKEVEECIEEKLNTNNILEKLNSGINTSELQNSIKACEKKCVKTKAIYRVIDLNDPFPGNGSNSNKTGFSLTNSKSRKPGTNWNSINTVTNKILNARGATGYELYNKDPLLTITLTPSTIKKIRKYNKDNAYDNFNLKCIADDKISGCISYFLRSSESVIGTSIKINGVSNCTGLNFSSDIDAFNKCYNSNN